MAQLWEEVQALRSNNENKYYKGKNKNKSNKREHTLQGKEKTGLGGCCRRHGYTRKLDIFSERESWQFSDLTFMIFSIYKNTYRITIYSESFILIKDKCES